MTSWRTSADDEDALRTPTVITLGSSLPAMALPSLQVFAATGLTTTGTTTGRSTRAVTGTPLRSFRVPVLLSVLPSAT